MKGKAEKIILVTNDDGVTAPGIKALIEAVRPLGKVVVVAPDSPQSGKGHAITIGVPLRLDPVDIFDGIEAWQCSGTPVDCVKLARDKILHGLPDLCVSGINHGANHSINVIYSGTMSAAMEAAIEGVPSVGFSYLDYSFEADFTLCKGVAHSVAKQMLETNLPGGTLLNVNIPMVSAADFKGVKVCRQADAKYVETFDERRDPRGKKYYWLTGEFTNRDTGEDTDVWALANNYASLVPVQFDLTDYKMKKELEKTWK
ncbi:5'/3'-nucleotidase SurE [Chitinophaga sancti]|uniref:5'-nucleotidase SurE n=1 Tax=Chitinophaga sancti TaxID=1004 RepID=A0A1K1PEZ8_9BACT|nr:5'/3'-nucleotidase SurE [Chitinophaga sancti]WQD65824.1 5'/3'-nucleotidase SurE [Chitinophaga sancti]WQG88554.1 5'/3'-nucleotidase SurE [Chitinophaga sancti]SFW46035.1 5'-nucleotidase /3'-nucleotidase /exopolyphosphatase [Chitinophaga sancti]